MFLANSVNGLLNKRSQWRDASTVLMNTVTIGRLKKKKKKKKNESASSSRKRHNLGRKRLNMHKQRSQCEFQLHAGQCSSVIEGVFGLSLSVLSNIAAAVSGEARGFKVGGGGGG
jgi:hypothetical protein